VVEVLRRNKELCFHSIRFSTLIKTIIAIHQETVTASKIELM
jgi:hypothetical protein